jgi:hypothetical protein
MHALLAIARRSFPDSWRSWMLAFACVISQPYGLAPAQSPVTPTGTALSVNELLPSWP